jgi:hypothetical protein
MTDEPQPPHRRRRLRRGMSARGTTATQAETLQEALAELALLRDENARLSAAMHEPASLGRLVARARAVGTAEHGRDDGDDVAQMMIDGVVLRDSLLEVCWELERSIAAVKARLAGIEHEAGFGSAAGGG